MVATLLCTTSTRLGIGLYSARFASSSTGEAQWPTTLVAIQFIDALMLIGLCCRFVTALKVNRKVGVLSLTMTEMLPDVLTWINLIMFPTMGFSLAFTAIMPSSIKYNSDSRWPFFLPIWGLLGELDIESISEYTPPDQWPAEHLSHGLLWTYSFIATVILVNLLIAQMSSTFARVEEKAAALHEYAIMQLVREHKDTVSNLPPPFTFIDWIIYFVRRMRRCGERPRTKIQKGFRWDPTLKDEVSYLLSLQTKMAQRAVKKRTEVDENSIDAKVDRLDKVQGELMEAIEGLHEKVAGVASLLKEGMTSGGTPRSAGAAASSGAGGAGPPNALSAPTPSKPARTTLPSLPAAPLHQPAPMLGKRPAAAGGEVSARQVKPQVPQPTTLAPIPSASTEGDAAAPAEGSAAPSVGIVAADTEQAPPAAAVPEATSKEESAIRDTEDTPPTEDSPPSDPSVSIADAGPPPPMPAGEASDGEEAPPPPPPPA
jgi:hypothetical protein